MNTICDSLSSLQFFYRVAQTGQGILAGTGWSQSLKQREPSLPQHVCSSNSSKMKFELTMNCKGIIMMIDVTQKNQHSMIPTTLVLTSNALFVMSEDEDCQLAAYQLIDITLNDGKDDPTLLQLTINGKPSKDEHEIVTKERIEQFVMESGFHVTVSDLDPTTDEEDAADSKHCQLRKNRENEEVNSSLTFYASPVARQAFVDAFEFALDQLRGYGFPLIN